MTTRIGVLGAARIVGDAIVAPAATMPDVEIVAVAARDGDRARAFAAQHHIPTSYGSYDALLAARDIDAVYIAVPAAFHARYAIAALAAGKHVLCEKPFAANAAEAEAIVAAGSAAGRVVAEAFHYYYHPYAAEMRALAATYFGTPPVHLAASFTAPIVHDDDIRRDYALGGGVLMDFGCYPIHWVRTLLRAEPTVVSVDVIAHGDIDETVSARLAFPDGATAVISCSMASDRPFANSVRATCPAGRIIFSNPLVPSAGNAIGMLTDRGRGTRTIAGGPTYGYQLAAFVDAIRGGAPMPTSGADSIANMRVIDAIYRTAGMRVRGDSVAT